MEKLYKEKISDGSKAQDKAAKKKIYNWHEYDKLTKFICT
jgi:hypothetical protein